METKTIYIVTSGTFEGYRSEYQIEDVFDDKSKAESFIEKKKSEPFYLEMIIEEWEVK